MICPKIAARDRINLVQRRLDSGRFAAVHPRRRVEGLVNLRGEWEGTDHRYDPNREKRDLPA